MSIKLNQIDSSSNSGIVSSIRHGTCHEARLETLRKRNEIPSIGQIVETREKEFGVVASYCHYDVLTGMTWDAEKIETDFFTNSVLVLMQDSSSERIYIGRIN